MTEKMTSEQIANAKNRYTNEYGERWVAEMRMNQRDDLSQILGVLRVAGEDVGWEVRETVIMRMTNPETSMAVAEAAINSLNWILTPGERTWLKLLMLTAQDGGSKPPMNDGRRGPFPQRTFKIE